MSDPTADFFAGLPQRGIEPLLERSSGVLRFDLTRGRTTDHWLVTIVRGAMTVSREDGPADCVVRTEKQLFDGIAQGEVNAMAALLRGSVTVTGADRPHELEVLMLFDRLFPGPPEGWKQDRLVATGSGR